MQDEQYKKARNAAYKLLTFRDRTTYEITRKLKEKGFENDIVARVVEYLQEYQFINDQAYAERFIAKSGSCSIARIWGKLSARGVKNSVIEKALAGVEPDFEFQGALSLVMHKIERTHGESPGLNVISFLRNRGFKQDTVEKIAIHLEALQEGRYLDS